MKLALAKLPATYADWYKRPVLGLACIAACVKEAGTECRIFDAYYHRWDQEELLQRLIQYQPDVVGITAMTHEIKPAALLAAKLKEARSVKTIVGGCHVTALPERTLVEFPSFDYGVCGEGEKTTPALLEHIERNSEPSDLPGVVYRDSSGTVRVNEPQSWLTQDELDSLPFPDFTDYYNDDTRALAGKDDYYVMFTSRGCPYRCVFCMQALGHKVRRRSPEKLIAEMELAMRRWGAHRFDFADEIFLFDTPETRRFLQMMIDRYPRRITWTGLTRANFVNPDIIALAKKAGCIRLEMGVESGDDAILKRINKGITTDQVRKAVKIIKSFNIPLGTYYILGHPADTPETVKKTIDFAVELNTDTIAMGIMVPYPGTEVHELALRGEAGYHLLTEDWAAYDKYGDPAMEIEGLPHSYLAKLQKTAILKLYIRHFRVRDCISYFWKRRKAILYFGTRRIQRLLFPAKERPTPAEQES